MSQTTRELQKKYLMPTYAPGLVLVRGKGARVWDDQGREYLDFLSGIAVLNAGHCHPHVVEAVQTQAETLMHVSNLYYNEKQPVLAQMLAERSLGGKCFFCNSGAEANEGLIKLARLWGKDKGKYEIITMCNSFHGRTLATLTATGQDKVQKGFAPLPEGFAYAEFNHLESCQNAVTDKTAAILVEAIQGEGGIIPAEPAFMEGLRALCDEKDILLLCDEVQCGNGRTGKWFGYQHYAVQPDAISTAKGLGNGFPIGAISCGEKLQDVFQPGHHATTFGGTPLACAAAIASIEALEQENALENATRMGELLVNELSALANEYAFITSVRGKGLMIAIVMDRPCKDLEKLIQEEGLLTLTTANECIRLLPSLTITENEAIEAIQKINTACRRWAKTL